MLSIQRSSAHSGKCTPNLLPCRVDHSGPVNASDRYWQPEEETDGTQMAYFRGRKLRGRKLDLPDGYRGAVLTSTNKSLPQNNAIQDGDADEDEEEQRIEVRVMDEVAEFDEVVVWGHEALPEETEDPYSKGVKEWLAFAGAIHSSPKENAGSGTSSS